jgi:polyhydroxyalkanoate synthesis repressor PhaR
MKTALEAALQCDKVAVQQSETRDVDPIIIKKYPNRRLYHTGERRYVNLEEIEQLVRAEVEFVVQDASSGQDITRRILVQVILEQMKEFDPIVPADFLKLLIKGRGSANVWQDYVQRMMAMAPQPGTAWSDWLGLIGAAARGATRPSAPEPPPPPEDEPPDEETRAHATRGPASDPLRDQVEALRRKMEELEGLLGKKPGRKR